MPRKSIERKIKEAVLSKIKIRITGRVRCDSGFEVHYPDASCPNGQDCITVGSKAEALSLLLIKARIASKLTFSIKPAKKSIHPERWCPDCRIYHVPPLTKEAHDELKCRAKWREG